MLVLSRRRGERILIGSGIAIEVVEIRGGKVRLGIDAPDGERILREEVEARAKHPKTVTGREAA